MAVLMLTSSPEMYLTIRNDLNHYAVNHIKKNYRDELESELLLQQITRKWEEVADNDENIVTGRAREVYLELLAKQREWLVERNKSMDVDEEVIRRHLLLLDLEQEKLKLL